MRVNNGEYDNRIVTYEWEVQIHLNGKYVSTIANFDSLNKAKEYVSARNLGSDYHIMFIGYDDDGELYWLEDEKYAT